MAHVVLVVERPHSCSREFRELEEREEDNVRKMYYGSKIQCSCGELFTLSLSDGNIAMWTNKDNTVRWAHQMSHH
jgi:hypothetical protein